MGGLPGRGNSGRATGSVAAERALPAFAGCRPLPLCWRWHRLLLPCGWYSHELLAGPAPGAASAGRYRGDHLAAGGHVRSIFALRKGTALGAVIAELELIWLAADPEEFADRITYIPLH